MTDRARQAMHPDNPGAPEAEPSALHDDDDARWAAVLARDARAEGRFWLGVLTTGVYCRPGCKARTPNRRNVRFFASRQAAELAGLRPCKRCRPDLPPQAERDAALVALLCRSIDRAETPPSLDQLARQAGLSASSVARVFKAVLGVTPYRYIEETRARRVADALAGGARVVDAVYEGGYSAPSRFYEAGAPRLGMTPAAARRGGHGETIRFGQGTTPFGQVVVAATEKGVCALEFAPAGVDAADMLRHRFAHARLEPAEPGSDFLAWIEAALEVVREPGAARHVPLDLRGTAFQARVWDALLAIEAGQTASYAEIAARIGAPKAHRAVAQACATNKVPVLTPCHRVTGSHGRLGGYAYGAALKRKLLAAEGVDTSKLA